MKTKKIIFKSFVLAALIAANSLATQIAAQEVGKCQEAPSFSDAVFTGSGRPVSVVRPGHNGSPNGYELTIRASRADKFEVLQMPYISVLNLLSANTTSAKWQLEFATNMGQKIRAVRLKNLCNGEIKDFRLYQTVQLLDQ
jgi:hypothetical protein